MIVSLKPHPVSKCGNQEYVILNDKEITLFKSPDNNTYEYSAISIFQLPHEKIVKIIRTPSVAPVVKDPSTGRMLYDLFPNDIEICSNDTNNSTSLHDTIVNKLSQWAEKIDCDTCNDKPKILMIASENVADCDVLILISSWAIEAGYDAVVPAMLRQ